ncbi:MAG: tetratricopeptide repeat protein [Fimbriiglobus sp.]|nr:tetratricopeptide repeat protein [Fimbriiglobus sp.]
MRFRLFLPAFALFAVFNFAPAQKTEPKTPAKRVHPLAEADTRRLKGNYEEARELYAELAKKDEKLKPAAAVGIAETHRQAGEYAKAGEVLDAAIKEAPKAAEALAARAELRFALGQWDAAEKDADAAIAATADNVRARYVKACLLRERGKTDDAKEGFRWIVRFYNGRETFTADELYYIGLGAAEFARWTGNSKQFTFIVNTLVKDILKEEPAYWPAEQLAGELLLEKYNRPDAVDAFDAALKLNPKAADPLVGKAHAAMVKFDLKDADAFADQALKQNPKHPAALRVKADIQLVAGDFPAAKKVLDEAKTVNPRNAATLGRLAAVALITGDTAGFEAIEKEVAGFDTKPGVFYHELASALDERKQYARAEEYYKKAAELRPMLPGPRTGLGMLYLRLGNEAEGRKLLDEAFKADPFNIRVSNSRKVMAHLDKYKTIETDHYTLRYDPATDQLLAEWLAEYMEEVHAELKKQFGYEPPGKVLVEVFSTHEMFSGRTVGLPDLHTIGACTGRVVAMASPKAKGLTKPFNWGRVMRHELTHIFNLAQTDYQCPHWVTEGLAVQNEKMARPPSWSTTLRARFLADDLLNLDTIMLGFVRPKSPEEWTLAYCQSQLYVEYMVKAHGQESVGKMLNEFKAGKDTAASLKAACGVEKEAFEKGYKEHVAGVVNGLSGGSKKATADKPMTFDELKSAHEKNPDDLDVKGKLAEQYFRRNMASDAKKLADEVLAKDAGHPIAAMVKARLFLRGGDDDAANEVLEKAQKARPDDVRLMALVGRLHVEKKEYEKAAELFEKGRKLAPLDSDWLEQLAKIYKETKDTTKLNSVLAELVAQDPDELDGRVRLAQSSLELGNFARAEAFARDALMIDVSNADAKNALIEALKKQKKDAEAAKIEKRYAK